ncbi:MAG: KamA family radical SAM protein [bacterium]
MESTTEMQESVSRTEVEEPPSSILHWNNINQGIQETQEVQLEEIEEPPSNIQDWHGIEAKFQINFKEVKTKDTLNSNSFWNDWRWQLRNTISDVKILDSLLLINKINLNELERVGREYPFSITPYYLSLIDKNNPNDPIKAQCIPSLEEGRDYIGVEDDPLGEEEHTKVPGLVHRYPDRVLVTLTNICPVYCRHCTRKRVWHKGTWVRRPGELEEIFNYISQHKEVRDVILSGGDPFVLSTERLEEILKRLRKIPHVEIIRIGTRCPVVLPQRIDKRLVTVLKKYRPIFVNTHFNHPSEITKESAKACDQILCAGIPVSNQTVLLKGVNDSVGVMTKLCQALVRISVRPYYLFQCDPVVGTGHFRTSIEKGVEIIKGMRGFTSGLCIPTFVVDGPHGQGKVSLQPNYIVKKKKGCTVFRGYKGENFVYLNP